MKHNGLSNSLAGNDKSLSNSYLSHIVELLRQEVANLTAKENALEAITTEHIETQKEVVDTKTVNTEKVNTSSINDKVILTEVVNVLTNLKVNGKDVLTESTFQGPFTYKGVVEALPDKAIPGDVYITSNDMVNVFNGASWDEFILPVGTVSLADYNADKAEMLTEISNVQLDLNATKEDLNTTKVTLNEAVIDISDINTKLETKVDEAPKDANSYVRKNGEWVDLTSADNTVKSVAGTSTIENTEAGVKINSPKVEVTTADFKINGSDLPEVNKFALSKTTEADTEYHYELKFGRSPFDASSSTRMMYCGFTDAARQRPIARAAPEMFTVFTKNWQYTKWATSAAGQGTGSGVVNITAMDKDGNINLITNNFMDWIKNGPTHLQSSCFITFNQEYVPEGWDDTVYLFCTSVPYLVELKDGKFSRKIDIYNSAGGLKEQGYKPYENDYDSTRYVGLTGGKGLRNKNIQRICFTCFDTVDVGGSWAIIIGGDRNSKLTDPFDPTKCIYIKLPSTAYYGYACMAATDSAWYLQENATGRLLRVTPNGQVLEISLSQPVKSCGYNYIEYTDKNNKPAVAYYVQNETTGGNHYVLFLEESDGGQVNFVERQLTGPFSPTGPQRYSQLFKFMENSHYIFFTADFGYNTAGDTDSNDAETFGNATMKNILWYWDKKTLTHHFIYGFYPGLTFGAHDFIEMHKTKDNAIWFPYIIQDLTAEKRKGIIQYIADVDYTNIDESTNIDRGSIVVKKASVGTTHAFFSANTSTSSNVGLYYTHAQAQDKNNNTQWYLTTSRNQLSATNDDGILCIISADFLSIALCYGDGNIRVYPISSGTNMYGCDADKEPYVPDDVDIGKDIDGYPVLIGMKHGWMLRCKSATGYPTVSYQNSSYTYIGVHYINGEPTIATKPHLSKITRCGNCYYPQRYKWDKYSYLQTYDDYERRKKVLSGIMAYINYGNTATGNDSFFKEVRKETDKLNLVYDNKVISSVEQ